MKIAFWKRRKREASKKIATALQEYLRQHYAPERAEEDSYVEELCFMEEDASVGQTPFKGASIPATKTTPSLFNTRARCTEKESTPVESHPCMASPCIAEPNAAEPNTAEPNIAEPNIAQPDTTEPQSLSSRIVPLSMDTVQLEKALAERMKHLSDGFSEYLLYLIERKGMKNAEVYKRALVDKKTFSKIKNNPEYHPNRMTAMCLCMGAMLNLDEAKDLLARAGYALSPSDMTDVIFSFFLENEIYDMIELDIQLEEHDLPCLIS